MHCINVLPKALRPGKVKGCAILLGGKHTLQIGDLMGIPVVPFMRLETDEDYDKLKDFATRIIEFFAENALEHERFGEMLERIGLANVVEGLGLEVDPNMVVHPRSNPYVRMDDWDDQAEKWNQRKAVAAE
jgi:sulfite reductase alpha subunit